MSDWQLECCGKCCGTKGGTIDGVVHRRIRPAGKVQHCPACDKDGKYSVPRLGNYCLRRRRPDFRSLRQVVQARSWKPTFRRPLRTSRRSALPRGSFEHEDLRAEVTLAAAALWTCSVSKLKFAPRSIRTGAFQFAASVLDENQRHLDAEMISEPGVGFCPRFQ